MSLAVRRSVAALALAAAALAGAAYTTAHTDSVVRADSVWSTPVVTPAAPANEPNQSARPMDSVW